MNTSFDNIFLIVSMFILIGETMCPDELERHSEYNNTSDINRKTAFGNTLCDYIYIFPIFVTHSEKKALITKKY